MTFDASCRGNERWTSRSVQYAPKAKIAVNVGIEKVNVARHEEIKSMNHLPFSCDLFVCLDLCSYGPNWREDLLDFEFVVIAVAAEFLRTSIHRAADQHGCKDQLRGRTSEWSTRTLTTDPCFCVRTDMFFLAAGLQCRPNLMVG